MPRDERRPTLVANEIGAAIVAGRYPAGERLPGEMAATVRFAVSRPVYREAIRMLVSKGLVESHARTGTIVCDRGRWNLLDPDVLHWLLADGASRAAGELLELRSMLEPAAAAIAATRRGATDLAAMATALATMAETAPDSPAGQTADRRFHEAMFAATGNELVARLASIVATSVDFVAEYKRERHVHRDPRPDHEALYRAIAEQQPDQAHAAMRRLLDSAGTDLRAGG